MFAVSMYMDILSSALDTWVDELSGRALIDYALSCRAEALAVGPHRGDTAYSCLAAEIAYDRALIKLCETNTCSCDGSELRLPPRRAGPPRSGVGHRRRGSRRPWPATGSARPELAWVALPLSLVA